MLRLETSASEAVSVLVWCSPTHAWDRTRANSSRSLFRYIFLGTRSGIWCKSLICTYELADFGLISALFKVDWHQSMKWIWLRIINFNSLIAIGRYGYIWQWRESCRIFRHILTYRHFPTSQPASTARIAKILEQLL